MSAKQKPDWPNQVQTLFAQLRAARKMARIASEDASGSTGDVTIGLTLTSNLLASLALEMGLKSFYMYYFDSGPPKSHNLSELFSDLHDLIRQDIDTNYRANLSTDSTIALIALRHSPNQPAPPNDVPQQRFSTASELFDSVSNMFVRDRYFFENVVEADWAVIAHPIDQMDVMIEVLDNVFHHYKAKGGFGFG